MLDIKEIEKKTQDITDRIKNEINIITTHRAFPEVFANLTVEGTKLKGIASISSSSNTVVTIRPYEKSSLKSIEDVVRRVAGYGIVIKGDTIYLEIMPLYKEVIEKKTKEANTAKENALVALRQVRQDAMQFLKKNKEGTSENIIKKQEKDIQKIIDDYTNIIKKIPINII